MKTILDPSFRYTPSFNTDLKKSFAKIRRAQADKVPYMLVLGQREVESGAVAVRSHSGHALRRALHRISDRAGAAARAGWRLHRAGSRRHCAALAGRDTEDGGQGQSAAQAAVVDGFTANRQTHVAADAQLADDK